MKQAKHGTNSAQSSNKIIEQHHDTHRKYRNRKIQDGKYLGPTTSLQGRHYMRFTRRLGLPWILKDNTAYKFTTDKFTSRWSTDAKSIQSPMQLANKSEHHIKQSEENARDKCHKLASSAKPKTNRKIKENLRLELAVSLYCLTPDGLRVKDWKKESRRRQTRWLRSFLIKQKETVRYKG